MLKPLFSVLGVSVPVREREMAKWFSSSPNINCEFQVKNKIINHMLTPRASSAKRNQLPMVPKKKSQRRRLITISTSQGRWDSKWECNYVFSLHQLQLHDLVDDDIHKDTDVFINLSLEKVIQL
ncbi:coatomer [Striga asiatica]|uniref:Coatomer n=1 Tax=Striga asiatica TaxID=4170 RepID=A0A5A7RG50_STRAF|nr:coatomer [Striga asiatica]